MIEPIKFLFILTGASTYLVTKYIKVGIDDPSRSDNSTFHNDSWSELNRSANAIARLANNSTQLFGYAVQPNVANSASNLSNGSMANSHPRSNRFHNNQASSSSYHIALIQSASSNGTQHPSPQHALQNRTVPYYSDRSNQPGGRKKEESGAARRLTSPDAAETAAAFRPTFEIEINEEDDRDLPKRLLQISLNSEDSSQVLAPVTYYLDGEGIAQSARVKADNKFTINTTSGEIFQLKALDRDQPHGQPLWRLNAYAKSSQTGKTLGYADIVVRLRDINDNVPTFNQSVFTVAVAENASEHQHVTTVLAEDLDDPLQDGNAQVTYSIEQNQVDPSGRLIFAIEKSSGHISTAVCCLDRERRDNYTIRVAATDGGGLKSSALVNIKLLDVNDERPTFSRREWHVDVEENDSEVALGRGPRPSSSSSSELTSSTTSGNNSSMTSKPATTIARLTVHDNDLPATNQFNFAILAERHSRHFERLRDVDFPVGAGIATATANYSSHFQLSSNSDGSAPLRILRPLDYEVATQRFIALKVAVTDKGDDFSDPQHRDVAVIYIKTRNSNDNTPKFAQSFVNVTLPENTNLGTIITKFTATDADQNGHSQVLYSLDGETNRRRFFTIDSEGFVRLNRPLDRETVPTHIVKVVAADTDEPPLTSTATLVVRVDDFNDNAPALVKSEFTIMENSPPAKLGELVAIDADDYTKGNGPPFTFYLAPEATEQIKQTFRLESDFKGEGKAALYSKVPLDRESQKQFIVPVVIRDSGYPSLSSTASVLVNVGDFNDNHMRQDNGFKDVTVYVVAQQDSYDAHMQSLHKPIEIGQVNVEDPDDWDVVDKTFYWSDDEIDSNFYLDSESGMVSLKRPTVGQYELKFRVFDAHHHQQAHSTMRVTVVDIPLAAVINSASLRLSGLDAFHFISTWDRRSRRKVASLKERLEGRLKQIIDCDVLEIFSIMERPQPLHKVLDVRYFAKSRGRFLSAVYMNGLVQLKSDLISQLLLNVTQVGVNECMFEERHPCESSSCFTEVVIDWTSPSHLVHANFTSFVGVRLLTEAKCSCYYDNVLSHFDHKFCDIDQTLCSSSSQLQTDSCHLQDRLNSFTRNYRTSITNLNFQCLTNRDLTTNSRTFKGNGWIWLDPLPLCTKNFLSIQVITTELNGIIFYFGPLNHNQHSKDFIFLELLNGKVRLLFDFGSGIGELTLNSGSPLNDGIWHQIDLHFDTGRVQLVVDTCVQSAQKRFSGVEIELEKCSNSTDIPPFSELLNVNGPLQVGGLYSEGGSSSGSSTLEKLNPAIHRFYQQTAGQQPPLGGFSGCIRNIIFNSHIYDLVEVHHSHNSHVGCYSTNSLCSFQKKKCHNGACDGNYNRVGCVCLPTFYGPDCRRRSEAVLFGARSFVHLSMIRQRNSFQQSSHSLIADTAEAQQRGAQFSTGFVTQITFMFRTRQSQAEIVRLVGRGNSLATYCVVEIRDSRLLFRFKLNPVRSKSEKVLSIASFAVNDGKWHRVEAYRFGESAFLTLDKGGIGKSTRLIVDHRSEAADARHQVFELDEHQILLGGTPHYLAIGTTTVTNDFADGCLNDLKINDVHISLSDLLRTSSNSASKTAATTTTMSTSESVVERATEGPRWQQSASLAPAATRDNGGADGGPWTEEDSASAAAPIRISITAWQNVRLGCQPLSTPCSNVHCAKPRICVDEWLLAACRCPSGYLESEDGKNCTRTSELCKSNPCLCRRQATEAEAAWDGAQDSAKLSRLFSSSADNRTNCDQDAEEEIRQPTTVNARIFQMEYGLFVVVLIALVPLNIPFLIYIAYICCRNKQSRAGSGSSSASGSSSGSNRVGDNAGSVASKQQQLPGSALSEDIVRESIGQYGDEGGGEDDVRGYDLVALRIQIPRSLAGNVHFDGYAAEMPTLDSTRDKSLNFDTWQELTVI